ncbi:arabinose efflux permease family protein [Desulfosporosinus acidiphilus SJ4]|uniref:Arabinose efflux permease family protein n=1 Tax=Desulfosporosinus acidiphilus (strain DSM 22704 / JCM 16185 / SJ4) TaxID=646529 RepID=I4D0T4_DESAJ|nr:MFS transporter [Desulfosporosinus acidiphilus]AFM39408.1 arabinose efflux permease family protein [Desulfosporosinus acidiphilus SJ4]
MKRLNLNSSNRLWTKSYILILIINLFVYIAFYLLVPTLPAFAKQIGGSNIQASLVVSGFSISSLICRAVTGHVADKIDRKPLLLIGLLILALCTLSYMFLPISAVIVVRILQGVGWGMSSTAIAAVVSEMVPSKLRGEGMGYYSLSMIISMSLAPIIAIIVMNRYKFNVVAAVSIIFVGIAILLLQLVVIPQNKAQRLGAKKEKIIVLRDLIEKRALFPSFLCFLLVIPLCGIMSYIMLFGREIKLFNIWVYFIGHVSMILVTRSFVGKLFDKKGHAVVIIPGAISMIIGLMILSYVHSVASLVIASLFYGFGYGAVQPSLQAWAVSRSPAERIGAANGTFLSSMDLSFTIGSIILSLIADIKSYAIMYRFSDIFMVIFMLVYGFVLLKEKKSNICNEDLLENVS